MGATVHSLAVVEEGADLGDRTRVWHFAHVRRGARIGQDCNIGKDVYVDTGVVLGDGCKVQNGANLYKGLVVGDRVFIGPHAQFTNDLSPRAWLWSDDRLVRTVVEEGASIGANATVVCGVRIGRYAMVGAGSVVTRDVPAHGLVAGNPARLKGFVCACGRRLAAPTDRPPPSASCACGLTTQLTVTP